ncbi:hypothetical protein H4R34_002525 [Dimargaris verticillata]|uniref:EamA domain-containing protein n=1 Tax=Dimargaris verticillata TaxID=2761393 RepID=A0A9W8E970_9FUNG|nr:hypothetical protein H4R34_002525 [Dimargaris verticillata]
MPQIDYDNYRTTFGANAHLPKHFNVMPRGTSYALLAGSLAASASLFAKLAVDTRTTALAASIQKFLLKQPLLQSNSTLPLVNQVASLLHAQDFAAASHDPELFALVVRGTFIGLIFLCNALMWIMFSKALHRADSSVTVTVYNTAMNFFLTAILGHIAFDEPLSLRWWFGASLIFLGSILMSQDTPAVKPHPHRNVRNSNQHPPCRLSEKKNE